ncbi:hypothetical protein [Actinoplanes sp. L3-i22]|uniref:hypothetical protein n=1 Tax=Actinoplanes sp. L3-i22 TaxID=2836373 RepID=UPI001C772E72|nr:hypothetical protein [Actinoplanes sp. L3-i22]BCY07235.1 hypothetical protein L3i22_023230 [Actinoplanes sp. L3-i22]
MTDNTPARKVWRRSAGTPGDPEPAVRISCGGPDLTREEYYRQMVARREAYAKEQAQRRAEADAAAAAEAKAAARADDEDPDRAAERYRNDRYSVKLLRQDTNTWGGGGNDAGALG